MEIIEEQPETIEEIKKLEETMFHEVEHALNDIDSQIMSLRVQRKIQANLLNNTICKYNKLLSNIHLNKNVLNRINTQYNNDKTYLTNV